MGTCACSELYEELILILHINKRVGRRGATCLTHGSISELFPRHGAPVESTSELVVATCMGGPEALDV